MGCDGRTREPCRGCRVFPVYTRIGSWGFKVKRRQIKTDCSVNANLDGKTYCFGNEQAKQDFMKDPKANLSKADAYYQSQHHG